MSIFKLIKWICFNASRTVCAAGEEYKCGKTVNALISPMKLWTGMITLLLECQSMHFLLYTDGKRTLTQLSDAAHPRCEQWLLQCTEFGLGVAMTFAGPPRALLIPVKVQTLRKAQHTCRQHRKKGEKVTNGKAIYKSSFSGNFSVFRFCWCQIKHGHIQRRAGEFTDEHFQLNIQNRVGRLDDKTTFIAHAAASEQTFV